MEDCLDFFNRYIMGSVQIFTGFYFFTRFLNRKLKTGWCILLAVSAASVMGVMQRGSVAELFAFIFLLAAGGIFICRADRYASVLYAMVTAEIMQLCFGIFNSALCTAYPLLLSFCEEKAGFVFMAAGNMAVFAAVFFYGMVYRYFSFEETVRSQYIQLVLIPAGMILLMGEYISAVLYGNTVVSDSCGIADAGNVQMLVIQLLGMASLFCILYVYKKLLENFRMGTRLSLLEQEEHFLSQYVAEAKMRYEKTKSFRHDIENHMTVVKELIENGRYVQVLDYIGDMKSMTEELSFPYSTNHPVADILIRNKFGIAKSSGIDVSCSLVLPYPCPVRDIDFCVILSNLLDNAIHGCESMDESAEKFIRLSGSVQGDFILMEAANSFQGKRAWKEGTGLANVRAAAEKYQGAVHIETRENVFTVSVLLVQLPCAK